MKRLVRYPIESGTILDTITKFLKKFLNDAEGAFDIIETWATKPTEDNPQPAAAVPDHFVLDIMPSNDDENWDTGPVYKLLVKQIGIDDEDVALRFTMKPSNKAIGEQATDTATYALIEEDESESDADTRIATMIDKLAVKLLQESSDGEYEAISDIRLSS